MTDLQNTTTMNHRRNFRLPQFLLVSLGLFALILSASPLKAGRIEFNNRIEGSAIVPNTFLYAKDDLFPPALNNANWLDGYAVQNSRVEIELGIDRSSLVVEGDFTATVQVRYLGFDKDFNQSSWTETLVVNYAPGGGTANEKIKDIRTRDGIHYAIVEIQQVTISGNVPVGVTPQHVYLENRIVVERTRMDDGMYDPVTGVAEALQIEHQRMDDIGEMEVRWEFVEGAEEYELEWTFVTAVDDPLFNYSTALEYDFHNNATRISTPFNFYRIPLMYEQGYIIYRIRAIRHEHDGELLHRVPTRWTSDQYDVNDQSKDGKGTVADIVGFVSDADPMGIHVERMFGEHRDLNWQFSATYVEGGVRSATVSFMDGTMRNRQTVAKNNADSLAVVAETFYDHQGRPAVQALPAPAIQHDPKLRYFTDFNKNAGGTTFSKADFDLDSPGACEQESKPFGTTSGAGYYYSSASYSSYFGSGNYTIDATHRHWTAQTHLPDAGGYPFVQTTYTPDATGRINSQSTVGPDHHLGSGHEVRYFYGSAEQEDLDKLFGSEVGFAEHYRKNMVVDANGQVSVSYLDGAGEVIATALAGASPDNLMALDSNIVRTDLHKNMLLRNEKDLEAGTLVSVTEFMVTSAGRHDFEYEVDDHQMYDICVPGGCYDCIYDLEITVLDDCGNDVLKDGPVSIRISGPELDGMCTPNGDLFLPNTTYDEFFADLAVGKYTAIKHLKVNEEAIEAYSQHYLEHNICLKDLSDFVHEEMLNIDTSGCNIGCDDCPAEPATYTDPDLEELCTADCQSDWCEALHDAMLNDMSPGGQYATWRIALGSGGYVADDAINIFAADLCLGQVNSSTGGITTVSQAYKQPVGGYKDADGNAALVDGVAPENLSITDFIQNWEASWAEALLPYHPEYCYWLWCGGLDAEHAHGEDMLGVETYAGGQSPVNYFSPGTTDPLLTSGGIFATGTPQRTDWDNAWNNFVTISGTTYTLAQAAVIYTNCPSNPSSCGSLNFGMVPATQDAEWNNYKRMYFSFRQRMLDQYFHAYHPCAGQVDKPGTSLACGTGNWDIKVRLHPDFSDVNGIDINDPNLPAVIAAAAAAGIDQNCEDQCAAYRPYWEYQLEACSTLASGVNINNVLDDLQAMCELGCDMSNPLGASTLPPGPGYLSPSQSVTFSSFEDVINHYYGAVIGTNGLCSPLQISMPMPYGHPVPFVDYGCPTVANTVYWDDFEPSEPGVYQHTIQDFNNTMQAYTAPPCTTTSTTLVDQINPLFSNANCVPAYEMGCPPGAAASNGHWALGNKADCLSDPLEFDVTGSAAFPDPSGNFLVLRGEYELINNYTTYNNIQPTATGFPWDVYKFSSPSGVGITPGKTYEISYWVINLWRDTQTKEFLKGRFDPTLDILAESFYQTGGNPGYTTTFPAQVVPKDPNRWKRVAYTWTAPDNPNPNPNESPSSNWAIDFTIRNYMVSRAGNDFGIDRVMIRELESDCCLDCEEMAALKTDFETETGYTTAATANYWDLFATWANAGLNYSLTTLDYQHFHEDCNTGRTIRPGILPGNFRTLQDAAASRDTFVDAAGDTLVTDWLSRLGGIIDEIGEPQEDGPLLLCNVLPQPPAGDPCIQEQMDLAVFTAQERYEDYLDSVRRDFRARYIATCLEAPGERFERVHDEAEYQYTLYYRDNTGALQATVPPEGVRVIRDASDLTDAADYREEYAEHFVSGSALPTTPVDPPHGLRTRYLFNSLMAVRQSSSPDKGTSRVWYDKLGRAIFSQDARQNGSTSKYTYTQYDFLSRPTEVGEMDNSLASSYPYFASSFIVESTWIANIHSSASTRRDITYTWYDATPFSVPAFQPENLRNRVAATARRNSVSGPYDYLCHYRYDEHGNVKELINEFTELHAYGQGYKRLRYDYDLISGNVKRFAYQENEPDQWIHRYYYDASNRLTVAQTSTNNVSWDRDEKAFYYLHGARARQEIGDEKVQALDYAHTIHGWIRGLNSGILDPNRDMGSDGKSGIANRWVGRDAWAFELGFYQGDYQSIGGTQWQTSVNSTFGAAEIKDLYNGNIAWQVISNKKLIEEGAANATVNQNPLLKRYRYDQLNRLKSMDVFIDGGVTGSNTWSTSTAISSDYHTDYKYDRNGNILTLNRDGVGTRIDALTYAYDFTGNMLKSNKLYHVNDSKGFQNANDLDDQGLVYSISMGQTNYQYDPIGNLISDAKEKTSNIVWDHYGKIAAVERDAGSAKPRLWFEYGPMGNRVKKTTQPEGSSDPADKATQYYLRDPQGNVIAIYAHTRVGGNDVLSLTEQHIYGSARLGLQSRDLVVYNAPTGSGIGGGNRTSVLDSTGKKGIVITEVFPESVFGDTDNGKLIILGNVSSDRISLDGLYLAGGGQSFAVPAGYVLDSAERLVVAYGADSLQSQMVSFLGWPADTTLQWIWQDGFVLSDSGEVSLVAWDGEEAMTLDAVTYGENRTRRTFAGRDAEAAGTDFSSEDWSLGASALERKSDGIGFSPSYSWTQYRGAKNYELSDHLGNVAVVVSDRRIAMDPNADLAVDFFEAEVVSARDFYPFGMVMPERSFSTQAYRYGFNGKEFDSEWKGEGNSYDYGFRVHDVRLGRFLSVDPLAPDYPWYTPYQFAGNKPIQAIDLDGLEEYIVYLDEGNNEVVKTHLNLENMGTNTPFITIRYLKYDWRTGEHSRSDQEDKTLGFLPQSDSWEDYYKSLLEMYKYADENGYIMEKDKIDSHKASQFEKWLAKNTDASENSRFHKALGRTDGTGEKKEATGAVSSTDRSTGERKAGGATKDAISKNSGRSDETTNSLPSQNTTVRDTFYSVGGLNPKTGGSYIRGQLNGINAANRNKKDNESLGYKINHFKVDSIKERKY